MDVHIHMSYCTPHVFRQLAFNHLKLEQHSLFPRIEEVILVAHVTPAKVAEQLLKMKNNSAQLSSTIVEMGLSKSQAEEALWCVEANSVGMAMEWLFSHTDDIVQEDDELARALALSLGSSSETTKAEYHTNTQ
ncbi:hypothetical protein K1719_010008 [Acacia pycnantha]|nr:hypothetical protein K1719_010008 [Acacia pycnantha]